MFLCGGLLPDQFCFHILSCRTFNQTSSSSALRLSQCCCSAITDSVKSVFNESTSYYSLHVCVSAHLRKPLFRESWSVLDSNSRESVRISWDVWESWHVVFTGRQLVSSQLWDQSFLPVSPNYIPELSCFFKQDVSVMLCDEITAQLAAVSC